jgi:hypothetical protein
MPDFDCDICGTHVPDWKKDFDSMRSMQSKFMWADHRWRDLEMALREIVKCGDPETAQIADSALLCMHRIPGPIA